MDEWQPTRAIQAIHYEIMGVLQPAIKVSHMH